MKNSQNIKYFSISLLLFQVFLLTSLFANQFETKKGNELTDAELATFFGRYAPTPENTLFFGFILKTSWETSSGTYAEAGLTSYILNSGTAIYRPESKIIYENQEIVESAAVTKQETPNTSGLLQITNVSGNGNTVNNTINFDSIDADIHHGNLLDHKDTPPNQIVTASVNKRFSAGVNASDNRMNVYVNLPGVGQASQSIGTMNFSPTRGIKQQVHIDSNGNTVNNSLTFLVPSVHFNKNSNFHKEILRHTRNFQ